MTKPPPFKDEDRTKVLLWCDRHCCLCGKVCSLGIELHHIRTEGENLDDIDNALPVCFECHGILSWYNSQTPRGTKYREEELKLRRNQIYEKYTSHLVPPVVPIVTQSIGNSARKRPLPDVGFNITNQGNYPPVKVKVEVRVWLGTTDLGLVQEEVGYYSGRALWHLNPWAGVAGHFKIPQQCADSKEKLSLAVNIAVVDPYEREHRLLPMGWTYIREGKNAQTWYLEPKPPKG